MPEIEYISYNHQGNNKTVSEGNAIDKTANNYTDLAIVGGDGEFRWGQYPLVDHFQQNRSSSAVKTMHRTIHCSYSAKTHLSTSVGSVKLIELHQAIERSRMPPSPLQMYCRPDHVTIDPLAGNCARWDVT